ncbi:hypothetical protein Taro_004681, partial [Colocasia esculenta]|nr:hypothetical protein [Colocasia esculenta]
LGPRRCGLISHSLDRRRQAICDSRALSAQEGRAVAGLAAEGAPEQKMRPSSTAEGGGQWPLKKTARRRGGYLAVVETGFSRGTRARFYSFIKAFLFLSVAMLGFEVMAYFKGWHLGAPELQRILAYGPVGVRGVFDWLYLSWVMVTGEGAVPRPTSPVPRQRLRVALPHLERRPPYPLPRLLLD